MNKPVYGRKSAEQTKVEYRPTLGDKIAERLPGPVGRWAVKRRHKLRNAKPPETFIEHLVAWGRTLVWAFVMVTIVNGIALASFVVPTGSMEDTVLPGEFLFVNKFSLGPSTPQVIPFLDLPLPYWKFPAPFPPKQGDVIVFVYPGDVDQVKSDKFTYYLKRCVAVSGDTLVIKNRRIYVNGTEFGLPEHGKFASDKSPYAQIRDNHKHSEATFPPSKHWTIDNYGPIVIPKEGDVITLNRENFIDWAVFIAREGHDVDAMNMTIDGNQASSYTVERDYVFGMGDNRDNSLDSRFWGFVPKNDVVGIPMCIYWSWKSAQTEQEIRMDAQFGVESDQEVPAEAMSGWGRMAYRFSHIRWNRLGKIIK